MEPIRILLLEDDRELRNVLSQVLEFEGYQVLSAEDGAQAVQTALEFPFELLVFDVKLPGPDGLEVLAQFRKENPDLPSIVITGYATEADTLRALRLGVGEYLKKPFSTDTLLDAVKRLERQVFRQRQLQNKEQSAIELVLWSLEFLASSAVLTRNAAEVTPVEGGRLAFRAAAALGHAKEVCQELQAAVLLRCLEDTDPDHERLQRLRPYLPGAINFLAQEMQNESAEGLARIGYLCLRMPTQADALEKLESLVGQPIGSQVEQRWDQKRRHLLSLGRSLAASGDLESAISCFRELTDKGHSREVGYGLVEMSKIAWRSSSKKEALAHLKAAMNLLPSLGPQAACELELETAHACFEMGLPQATELLTRCSPRLKRLGLDSLSRQVELVLLLMRDSGGTAGAEWADALRDCLKSSDLGFLIRNARWILKPMLEKQEVHPSDASAQMLKKLIRLAPSEVSRVLDQPGEEKVKFHLLSQLVELESIPSKESIQRLASHSNKELSSLAQEILTREAGSISELRILSLGLQEVWLNDIKVPLDYWRTSRSRFLLACLAQAKGRPLVQDALMEQFWPGVSLDRGRKNLSQTVSDLRKGLTKAGYNQSDALVIRKQDLISLNQELPIWHDLEVFEEKYKGALIQEERGELREAASRFREAILLARGSYLEDCSMDWAENKRRDFEISLLDALERLAQITLQLELYPEVLEVANRILATDPCHQMAHCFLMKAFSAQKRPELAVRQFEIAKVTLLNEMGLEPHTDLVRELHIAKMTL